ncbi:hypothetical protein HUJ05_000876 [Dendroctonus ponderosae]|nr:hypothetical protein HUJ05_000876 [Dendroctonus ponderosae]
MLMYLMTTRRKKSKQEKEGFMKKVSSLFNLDTTEGKSRVSILKITKCPELCAFSGQTNINREINISAAVIARTLTNSNRTEAGSFSSAGSGRKSSVRYCCYFKDNACKECQGSNHILTHCRLILNETFGCFRYGALDPFTANSERIELLIATRLALISFKSSSFPVYSDVK